MPTIRAIRAWHTDTVEITWDFPDGEVFIQRVSHPPKATREAQTKQQVPDRTETNAAGQKM